MNKKTETLTPALSHPMERKNTRRVSCEQSRSLCRDDCSLIGWERAGVRVFLFAATNVPAKRHRFLKSPSNVSSFSLTCMKFTGRWFKSMLGIASAALLSLARLHAETGGDYQIFVTNEKSGDLTVINGADFKVTGTIHAGKRP